MNWRLRDARNNFSKVVQMAKNEGPQTVTLRGRRAAVVLSAEDYDRLLSSKPSFVEHLLSGPAWDDDFIEELDRRGKKPSRPLSF